jgi:hypothetical protein
MNRALLLKEWRQARAGILITGVMLSAFWLGTYAPEEVLFGGSGPGGINLVLILMAGLTVPLAQFASESILGTRDVLVFRATGPPLRRRSGPSSRWAWPPPRCLGSDRCWSGPPGRR